MRGTIEQVWENESRNGQQYLTVQIDGNATVSGTPNTSTSYRKEQRLNTNSARVGISRT